MSKSANPPAPTPAELHQQIRIEGGRETVESIVVAIILALLFRSFVAEAFVIPTGSMAPALMGAHKDLECLECGQPYQAGASVETDSGRHVNTVVATFCPNCRNLNPLDLVNKPNDASFAGDRILVSKFAYALSDPKRWDVIVFKFPGNPKQNYIKRLVGLPSETLRIRHGDVFAKAEGADAFSILRKDHEKLLAMSHTVHDTQYQSKTLIDAGFPSNWQPWQQGLRQPPSDSWQVTTQDLQWSASLSKATDQLQMMRYFHRWPDEQQWEGARNGLPLTDVDPFSSRAVTDYYPYDAYVYVDSEQVYEEPPGVVPANFPWYSKLYYRFFNFPGLVRNDYQTGVGPEQFDRSVNFGRTGIARDGNHWVGDLIVEATVEGANESGEIVLELVESAVLFRCYIRLSDGQARLEINDINGPLAFNAAGGTATQDPVAETAVRAGQQHAIRFANCDDQLYLWIDGKAIEFDQPTTFDMSAIRPLDEQRPYRVDEHPFDAAPVAVGARGTTAIVHRLQIARDKYYIAVADRTGGFHDYAIPAGASFNWSQGIQETVATPALWDDSVLWEARRTVEFTMEADQFFPMGDNSPESLDARCWVNGDRRYSEFASNRSPDAYLWAEASYVPRDLLVGKALMVFWPHTWNAPIPLLPNVKRIGLIR